ncbi:MAG TPA: hypothetical protein VGQ59_14130 [Cyclobacteriaceae bacterium]|jgi:hypothetical protein|nr:hypothetical protein [Cyclobacteriaceae bacterium]
MRLRKENERLIEDSVGAYEEKNRMVWRTRKLKWESILLMKLILLQGELSGTPSTPSDVLNSAMTVMLPIFPLPEKIRFVGREKFKMVLTVKKATRGARQKLTP